MVVHVYGKPGCEFCVRAKDKLRRLGVPYEDHDIREFTAYHEGWREDGSVDVLAAYSEMNRLPLIRVGEKIMDYTAAMKALKQVHRQQQERVGA